MNRLINASPLIILGILGYFSFTKAQPVSLLPGNKPSLTNPDMPANLAEYEVVPKSVHDGDTLRVRSPKGEILKVRFACIDAPELKQPLGEESRNHLRSIINKGNNKVRLQPITVDRYGRTVAQLWNNNGLIQSQMTIAGMAYGYEQYKRDCPNWEAVRSTEAQAQEAQIGVWKLPGSGEKPWDYRKSKR
ncbi:thermonuclease family protein [Microcoleus sp. herbarium5]|uniref:thermonuclease family protein n=1 Tax=Microcoleus sp. herbarium5 TaxID=3055434 RepID=UPI002FD097D9